MNATPTTVTEYTNEFIIGYKVAALWSSTDENDVPLDNNYGIEDFSDDADDKIREDCESFVSDNWMSLHDLSPQQCGHDFWLTRNRHGAGFWDRGLGNLGNALTEECRPYGEVNLYDHNGLVEIT